MNSLSTWLSHGHGDTPTCLRSAGMHVDLWQSVDGSAWRAYASGGIPEGVRVSWAALLPLLDLQGASRGEVATHHYVVETDVSQQELDEFNAWYDTEHVPGLARVPGTVRARRFRRLDGNPRFIACYDLTTLLTLERPEWLAVRHTPWSDRVRLMFRGTIRTMYQRAQLSKS